MVGLDSFAAHSWAINSPTTERQLSFMKNLALMGAMLFIIANGAGPISVDAKLAANDSK